MVILCVMVSAFWSIPWVNLEFMTGTLTGVDWEQNKSHSTFIVAQEAWRTFPKTALRNYKKA